jgi:integrase
MLKNMSKTVGRFFNTTNFRKTWKKAIVAAKCPALSLHDFRQSTVTNLIDAGTSETDAMLISGHKSRTVFDRYSIRNTDRLH